MGKYRELVIFPILWPFGFFKTMNLNVEFGVIFLRTYILKHFVTTCAFVNLQLNDIRIHEITIGI